MSDCQEFHPLFNSFAEYYFNDSRYILYICANLQNIFVKESFSTAFAYAVKRTISSDKEGAANGINIGVHRAEPA